MDEIYESRKWKIEKILEQYSQRKTQQEVAQMFSMSVADVAKVTRGANYVHTRKITSENRREGESIKPVTFYEAYDFLDKYPMENFRNPKKI